MATETTLTADVLAKLEVRVVHVPAETLLALIAAAKEGLERHQDDADPDPDPRVTVAAQGRRGSEIAFAKNGGR